LPLALPQFLHLLQVLIFSFWASDSGAAAGTDERLCQAEVRLQQERDHRFALWESTSHVSFRMAVDEWLNAHRESIKDEAAANEQRIGSQANAIMRWAAAEASQSMQACVCVVFTSFFNDQ
jgi:hypothetical protein